jgi:hypothetical protein
MSKDAIIGHTGFVGGILDRQHAFETRFNSANIDAIAGQTFDTVVCAAAPGSMFTANREPDHDRAQIEALIKRLDAVSARRFVLISSIAVLADFSGGDDEVTQAFQADLAYGRHRRLLETFCENRFDDFLVVRLPALFGPGLRKNFIFDLMNPVPAMLTQARLEEMLALLEPTLRDTAVGLYTQDAATGLYSVDRQALDANPLRSTLDAAVREVGMSATQFHNPDTTYQYYDMSRLWNDIGIATQAGLTHIHLVTEPLRAADIHSCLLGADMPHGGARLHREDMRTRHAALWGREGPYLENAARVMERLKEFFASRGHAA